MAFRKRNVAIGRSPGSSTPTAPEDRLQTAAAVPGVRPSPLTSHAVTSTGTPSLDGLLGGHAGLALGSSLLIEESGTTDYAGALLRYYAAEGVCHGHVVHVVGVGDAWARELPGLAEVKRRERQEVSGGNEEKMKIAWRYERLGQTTDRAPDRSIPTATGDTALETPFCHTFDLTKRLTIPPNARLHHIPITSASLEHISQTVAQNIAKSPSDSIHRLVIPSILSPALYPPTASRPEHFLAFLRTLRALLRQHATRLTAMLTLPLELHPRTSGLVHWAELLSDGVLELTPFPHRMDAAAAAIPSTTAKASDEQHAQPQGLVRVHRLPISTERGEGGAGANTSLAADLAFTVSRRRFAIAPFALPPIEGDTDAQRDAGKPTAQDMEF